MPKLIDEDTGEVVMEGLKVGELRELEQFENIEFDIPEDDYDDLDFDEPLETTQADDLDEPEELVKSDIPATVDEATATLGDEDKDGTVLPENLRYEYDDVEGSDSDESDDESQDEEHLREKDESEIEERFDVDLNVIEKVDNRDRVKWARLIKQLDEYGREIPRRLRERNDRIESNDYLDANDVRRKAERNNVITDLREGFMELVSRPVPQPSMAGPQLDPMNVARRASGDMSVQRLFEESVEVEVGDRVVGLCTDFSGSMAGDMLDLAVTAGAVAKATDIIGDEFVWNGYGYRRKEIKTPLVTGPNESFEWEHTESVRSMGSTPTASGIRDCEVLMEKTSVRKKLMIVITDGMANITEEGESSSDNEAVEQARLAVDECQSRGIDVIGIGIGDMSEQKMDETFGKGNHRLTTIDTLAEDILTLYAKQLDVNRGLAR